MKLVWSKADKSCVSGGGGGMSEVACLNVHWAEEWQPALKILPHNKQSHLTESSWSAADSPYLTQMWYSLKSTGPLRFYICLSFLNFCFVVFFFFCFWEGLLWISAARRGGEGGGRLQCADVQVWWELSRITISHQMVHWPPHVWLGFFSGRQAFRRSLIYCLLYHPRLSVLKWRAPGCRFVPPHDAMHASVL